MLDKVDVPRFNPICTNWVKQASLRLYISGFQTSGAYPSFDSATAAG